MLVKKAELHGCVIQPFVFDRYQWFCHSDDDVYVNVPKLSRLLQQYDPHKPYYIGKWLSNHHKYPFPVSANSFMYSVIIIAS